MAVEAGGEKECRSWRNPEQVSSVFQVHYWIRSLGDVLHPHADLKDIESEPFKTAGDQFWELCLSPLVVWDTEHQENAKCGRHWTLNTRGKRVCEDGALDPKFKYIGLWLRCLSSSRCLNDSSVGAEKVVRYTISLKSDSGKLIAINQDIWVPFIYSSHLRGTYWFCSHSDILNSYDNVSRPQTGQGVAGQYPIDLQKKLFVCVQWEFETLNPLPYPFALVSSKDDSRRLITLQLGGDKIKTHEALVRCSSVLSQALDDLPKSPSAPENFANPLRLDDVVSSLTSGTSLQEFYNLVHAPTEYTILKATDRSLADLLRLSFELELPSLCSVVESVIRSRCKSPGTVMQFYQLLGRCMPWKMIFWTEIYLSVSHRYLNSGISEHSALWLVKIGIGDEKLLVKKFLQCRPHLTNEIALKKALDHGSDYLLLAATRHMAFNYLRQWVNFLVGFTPKISSEQIPFGAYERSSSPSPAA